MSVIENAVTDPFVIGHIMGLVTGEGSFSGDATQPCLGVKLHASDPAPLQFLQLHLGGRLYGPYESSGRVYRTWLLRGPALRDVLPLFEAHLPPSRKREQFLVWRAKWFDGPENVPKPRDAVALDANTNDPPPSSVLSYDAALEEFEREYVKRIVQEAGGNRSRAARWAGFDRTTLYRMAERLGVTLAA